MVEQQRFSNIKKNIQRAGEAIRKAVPSTDELSPEKRAENERRARHDYYATSSQGNTLTPAELRRLTGR